MLDYARTRAIQVLRPTRRAVLATHGPAGLQVAELPCQAVDLDLYILLPWTCDHLFNLERNPSVTLLAATWELEGAVQLVTPFTLDFELQLLREPGAGWCALLRVIPHRIQIRRPQGWGYLETLEIIE